MDKPPSLSSLNHLPSDDFLFSTTSVTHSHQHNLNVIIAAGGSTSKMTNTDIPFSVHSPCFSSLLTYSHCKHSPVPPTVLLSHTLTYLSTHLTTCTTTTWVQATIVPLFLNVTIVISSRWVSLCFYLSLSTVYSL